jgi:hypothetical protein
LAWLPSISIPPDFSFCSDAELALNCLRPARADYPFFFRKKTRAAATIAKLLPERKQKQRKNKEKCGFCGVTPGKPAKNAAPASFAHVRVFPCRSRSRPEC